MSQIQSRRSSPPSQRDGDINYHAEAFKKGWNLAYISVAFLIAVSYGLATGEPLAFLIPFLLAMVPEALYLGIVPDLDRFRRSVRAKPSAAPRHDPAQKDIYRQLSRRSQRRYARLRQLEDTIEDNYKNLSNASQELLQSHLHKLDGLLSAHLDLLQRHERYRTYADAETESEVNRSIEAVRERLEEASPRVRKVKERRLRILKQRQRRFREGHEHREIIEAQLQTIEDVVRYIHEQSWALQDPEEITHQLDTLLDELEREEAERSTSRYRQRS